MDHHAVAVGIAVFVARSHHDDQRREDHGRLVVNNDHPRQKKRHRDQGERQADHVIDVGTERRVDRRRVPAMKMPGCRDPPVEFL